MKKETKLQIPISIKFKKALEKRSEELGFSSANELVRVITHTFISGNLALGIMNPSKPEYIEILDEATEKRLGKSLADYKAGRYTTIDPSVPGELDRWINSLK